MRSVIILCSVLVAIAGIAVGTSYWVSQSIEQAETEDTVQAQNDLAAVKELLQTDSEDDAQAALDLIMENHDALIEPGEVGRQWTDLFITACVKLEAWGPLISLFDFSPATLDEREDAAIPVAALLIHVERTDDYQRLRDRWVDRTEREDDWFLLDAAHLTAIGDLDEAVEALASRTLSGESETRRLVHLGMLHVKSDPTAAWDYLTQAARHDDDNPDIHLLRARLLEAYNKIPLAEAEYFAAIAEDTQAWRLYDELGEFYRRQGRYRDALLAWGQGLKQPNDIMWAKVKFWSMLLQPVKADWPAIDEMQDGPLKPLYAYLQELPASAYWDETAAAEQPEMGQFLTSHQAPFWLRLVEWLRAGNEEKAGELVALNTHTKVSWEPDLELAMKRIFHFRKHGILTHENLTPSSKKKHGFFQQLDKITSEHPEGISRDDLPDQLLTLLDSDEVFAAAFLAAGWNEAALQVSKVGVLPVGTPEWVAYMTTQALRTNRGSLEALAYASRQQEGDPLTLLMGEILISTGDIEAGKEKLQPYATTDSVVGLRAAWLLSMIALEQKEFEAANTIVDASPQLSEALIGKELKARIALLQGDDKLATQLYGQIQKESTEAKSYLAKRAFAESDFNRARALTEELLKEHPNNATIRKNYNAILKRIEDES